MDSAADQSSTRDETVIKLVGGVVVKVYENVETLGQLAQGARRERSLFQVNTTDGKALVLNPEHVVYMEGRR